MQTTNYKQTLINFLNENIEAASICLISKPTRGSGYQSNDVLGFPAAILILSAIDAIGTIKCGKNKSFEVLSTPLFDSQKISKAAAQDLYQSYRNPFFHNNILLPGRSLSKGDGLSDIFTIKEDRVVGIDLTSLLKACGSAIGKFESSITEEEILGNNEIQKHIDRSPCSAFEAFSDDLKANEAVRDISFSAVPEIAARENIQSSGSADHDKKDLNKKME